MCYIFTIFMVCLQVVLWSCTARPRINARCARLTRWAKSEIDVCVCVLLHNSFAHAFEGLLHKLPYAVHFPCRYDKINRLLLLQHQPHRLEDKNTDQYHYYKAFSIWYDACHNADPVNMVILVGKYIHKCKWKKCKLYFTLFLHDFVNTFQKVLKIESLWLSVKLCVLIRSWFASWLKSIKSIKF